MNRHNVSTMALFFKRTSGPHRTWVRLVSIFFLSLALLSAYVALSLFEAWASVPFWVQNAALIGGVLVLYLFARKTLGVGSWEFATRPLTLVSLAALAVLGFAAMLSGFQTAGSAAKGRIMQGFMLSLRQPPAEALFTLTAVPPDYLDKTKATLFSEAHGPVARHIGSEPFVLPEGTLLKIVVAETGNFTPTFVYRGASIKPAAAGEGRFTADVLLLESGILEIRIGPYVSFSNAVEVIPDREPGLTFVEAPSLTKRDSLKLLLAFEDDHGLQTLALEISRRGLTGLETEALSLPLVPGGAAEGETAAYVNLLAHRWAGMTVEAAVVGRDALGQTGRTKTVSLRLPQKDFTNPAAGVLASVRSALINNPEWKNAQIRRLDVLTQDKTLFAGRLGLYAALRTAYWKLRSSESEADIAQVNRLLWQLALAFEDDGSDEQQGVMRLFEDIASALAARGGENDFETLSRRLETRLRYLFDRELGLFSTRTGMAGGATDPAVPAPETFPGLIERMRALHAEGRDAEALAVLLQLQGYFEAFALDPEAPFPS
ncbi:MAG TPA: DUF4175 family protein [Sphingomonadales bacterium]|nr:DUF4175 family protein [Sphingomonadales bacterium]